MILHCAIADKFIQPFIDFIELNFDLNKHYFLVKKNANYEIRPRKNVLIIDQTISRLKRALRYIWNLNKAEKIILHGLFDEKLLWALALQPWLLRKCYWIIWGGDLYARERNVQESGLRKIESIRAFVIKRLGHFVTYVEGDYELARKWYGAHGKYHECFMYPSNLYKEPRNLISTERQTSSIKVLAGNSADPSNNHREIFRRLQLWGEQIQVCAPLSYGDSNYAAEVVEEGIKAFSDRFSPLFDFMTAKEYLEFLESIDIAVFAHRRQQAMGNSITLLGMGKKVFIRSDVTPWKLFEKLGVKIFDFEMLNIEPLDAEVGEKNKERIKGYFSEENLKKQWRNIFDG